MKCFFVLYIIAAALALARGYILHPVISARSSQALGMFGSKAPAKGKGFSITVDGKAIEASEPTNLRKVLQANKIDVYSFTGKFNNCGGSGICGKCSVKVIDGAKNLSPASKNEQNTIKITNQADGTRLSCCAKVSGPVSIKCAKPA